MKTRRNLFPMSLMILAILTVAVLAVSGQSVVATYQRSQPTPPPTATPGDPLPNLTSIPLAQPLATKEQALEQAAYYDAAFSTWVQPWSIDTLRLQPDRITIKAYPSRAAESAVGGWNEWFAPEIEADAGGVWAVTIKGSVQVVVPSPWIGASNAMADGVTYVISQRTGNLLTIRPIQPKK